MKLLRAGDYRSIGAGGRGKRTRDNGRRGVYPRLYLGEEGSISGAMPGPGGDGQGAAHGSERWQAGVYLQERVIRQGVEGFDMATVSEGKRGG